MLEMQLDKLKDGPFETDIAVHGPNVHLAQQVKILRADAVGIVAQRKQGVFSKGDWGGVVAYPWPAISFVRLGDS